MSDSVSDVNKMRLDYAWKWFAYHADQRIKAFNFMIITFGVLTTALVTAVNNEAYWAAEGASLMSIVLAFLFSRLDRRNRDLVRAGEAVLKDLEHRVVFRPEEHVPTSPKGLLTRDPDPLVTALSSNVFSDTLLGKHRIIIPAFAYLFALMFAAAFVWIVRMPK